MTEAASHWWRTGVIYQIYPRSFKDASGDGVGDLRGITEKLDYLVWLGVDALWLSPILSSPMADFGYDVADYRKIDPLFGTIEDFDTLLEAAHARGLKLVLDLVPNHTSDQHPWFLESRSSPDNPKRDWYIWADPTPEGDPPNNWLAYFGGPAWTFDEVTGQYYMHNFLPQQPDLNYRNPAVKTAMFDEIRFWLDRGVDGFRIDVVDRMLKDEALRDNPPNPDYVFGRDAPTNALLRVYSENVPGIHNLIKEFQQVFLSYDERVTIGEINYFGSPEEMTPFYGDSARDELDLPFNFGLILKSWEAGAVREFVEAYDAAVPPYGWPNYVLGNHDQHRVASRVFRPEQARNAALLLLTLRGTPFIYYGDEIGMVNVDIPQHLVQDPQGKNMPGYSRDVCRTPMQWDASEYAGFSDVEPWLPLAEDYEQVNVETQCDDPTSILTLHRRLLAYRRTDPVLLHGRYDTIPVEQEDCYVYLRRHEGQRRIIALNFSNEPRTLLLPDQPQGRIVLSTKLDREETISLNALTLRADEGVLIEIG